MRTLAVMQPYFLPYLGYWQLAHAADTFVLLDDVQYIRHGWVNRNRVLRHGGGWQYISVPLRKHAMTSPIREVEAIAGGAWKDRILRQLEHYRHGARAPFFGETREFLAGAFASIESDRLSEINAALVRAVCARLGIAARILLSSESGFSFADVREAGDWALGVARQTGAGRYVNPVAGAALFDPRRFREEGVELAFLRCGDIGYAQGRASEESLSIVDALMFNGVEGTRGLLGRYTLEPAPPGGEAPATRA